MGVCVSTCERVWPLEDSCYEGAEAEHTRKQHAVTTTDKGLVKTCGEATAGQKVGERARASGRGERVCVC